MENKDKWCKAIVMVLNKLDGWDLKYIGDETITAIGNTPKNYKCIVNIHFDIEQSDPYINEDAYNDLKSMDDDIAHVYMYICREANYMYWMNVTDAKKDGAKYQLLKKDAQIINYNT